MDYLHNPLWYLPAFSINEHQDGLNKSLAQLVFISPLFIKTPHNCYRSQCWLRLTCFLLGIDFNTTLVSNTTHQNSPLISLSLILCRLYSANVSLPIPVLSRHKIGPYPSLISLLFFIFTPHMWGDGGGGTSG